MDINSGTIQRSNRFSAYSSPLTGNGFGLCVRAGFGALHCQPALNLNKSTKLQVCTSARLTQNPCYRFGILFGRLILFVFQFSVNVQTYKFSVFNFTVSHCSFVLEVKFFHCVFTVQIVCFNKPFNSM